MARPLSCALLVLLFLSPSLFAHGGGMGKYTGPTDTVPPGAGVPGKPTGPAAPNAPKTGGPSGPAAAGPSTGGGGAKASATAAPANNAAAGGSRAVSGGMDLGPDLSTWDIWWFFNRHALLNLKSAVFRGVVTGSDDFFMGRGRHHARDLMRPSQEQIRTYVVPGILKVLAEETNKDIVTSCLIALGKIGGDPAFLPVIRERLADPNQEISETAAIAMGILRETSGLLDLMNLLRDTKEGRKLVGGKPVTTRTRTFAAYGLGMLAAGGHGAQAIPILLQTLHTDRSASQDIKVACVIGLGLAGKESALGYLQRTLMAPDTHKLVRAHCPLALARIAGPEHPLTGDLIQSFLDLLRSPQSDRLVRQSAVQALGLLVTPEGLGFSSAIKVLQECVGSGRSEQEKNFVMITLGKIGGPVCADLLLQYLQGRSTRGTLRPWAALGLGMYGWKLGQSGVSVEPIVGGALQEHIALGGNPSYLGAYAISLGLIGDTGSVEMLLNLLKESSDPELKGFLCIALGLLGEGRALGEIQDIVRASKRLPGLLEKASIGLGLLGDKDLVPYLVGLLEKSKSLYVQGSLASALGMIGDSRSIEPLMKLVQAKSVTNLGRAFGVAALGLICDKDLLPWNAPIGENFNYRAATWTLVDPASNAGVLDIL